MSVAGWRRPIHLVIVLAVIASTLVATPIAASQTGSSSVTVSVDPSSGPTGTQGTITVTGEANVTVNLEIGASIITGTTDANGSFTHTTTFSGAVGDVITIKATVGNNIDAPSGSTTFTITNPTPPQPTASVSVTPGSGPTGTQGTITVTGAANMTVNLEIGPTTVTGTTDANGTFTHTTTFSGVVGHVIPIKATVGNQVGAPSASTSFTITAPGSAFGDENAIAYPAFADPIGMHLRHHGWNEAQIAVTLDHAWDVAGDTQMYGFGDDPFSEPGVGEEEAAGTVPVSIGYEYVRITDPELLPPAVDSPTVIDGKLLVPFGDGPIEVGRLYAWYWVEFAADFPHDQPGVGLNVAFPSYVRDATRWASSLRGDSWTGGSHIPVMFNDPTSGDWFADLFVANDSGGLDPYSGPGGLGWAEGNTLGIYVPADALMPTTTQHIVEYGYAADIVLNPTARFDPNAPRKVTVYPPNFTSEGRDGLEPVTVDRFPINVGFDATYADARDAIVYRDLQDQLWVALYFLEGWPLLQPIIHFLEAYFSFAVGVSLSYGEMFGPFVVTQVHDGVPENLGSGPDGEFVPSGILVMEDGSLRINLEYAYSKLAGETDEFTIDTFGAYWIDEETTQSKSTDRMFEFTIDEILDEANPPSSGDPFLDTFFDLRTVFDVTGDQQLIDPVDLVDEPEPEPVPEPPEVTADEPAVTPVVVEEDTSGDAACWWCWGGVTAILVLLLFVLFRWLKPLDWWTCWIPWSIVIFLWVPFLLAGLWWWRPDWWWVPLLAWFPTIGGYTWYWAQRRTWWQPRYLYVVGGYLAVLALGMAVVGAPEWGLLFPLFWAPWVGFYVWFRGRSQPWWQPWMWGATGAYAAGVLLWVTALTPWWAWWLPVVVAAIVAWYFTQRGYSWRALMAPKWCWIVSFALLPFLGWWSLWWGIWWCVIVFVVLALEVVGSLYNHRWNPGWWDEDDILLRRRP